MAVQYLFNSSGQWIAFKKGKFVYNPSGHWLGWLPWGDDDIVDVNGNYLGTIFPKNRLFKVVYKPNRGYPGYPGYPGFPGYPGYPGYAGYSPLPANAVDVDVEELKP